MSIIRTCLKFFESLLEGIVAMTFLAGITLRGNMVSVAQLLLVHGALIGITFGFAVGGASADWRRGVQLEVKAVARVKQPGEKLIVDVVLEVVGGGRRQIRHVVKWTGGGGDAWRLGRPLASTPLLSEPLLTSLQVRSLRPASALLLCFCSAFA